jgi:hypothetical protein
MRLQRGMLVSLGLDQNIENFARGIDGAPEIGHSAMNYPALNGLGEPAIPRSASKSSTSRRLSVNRM